MADVAKLAGVAPITVSRVINHHPTVTPRTRAKVEQAITELGYRGNMAARTLAGGRSRVLSAVSVATAFYGPSQTLFGIEAAARELGYMVNIVTAPDSSVDEMRSAIDHLRQADAEGIIVIAPVREAVNALTIIRPDVPLVVTTGEPSAPATVGIDQAHGARIATAHLLDLGHHTVHHVRGPRGWLDASARSNGWRKELRARNRPVPRALLGDWTPRSGYAAGRVLAGDPTVTAVFVANDQMAVGVLLALREAGRDVPGLVSVIGFDDIPESEYLSPPLTTMRQDFGEVGRQSVHLLLGLIGGQKAERISLEPKLIVRNTTGPSVRL